MADVLEPNLHANIMLDLETTSLRPNAGIIELAAVYFGINTGAEYDSLKTPINLQSCISKGLVQDEETLAWVRRNIPETLATSRRTSITLDQALSMLDNFVRKSIADMRRRLREAGQRSNRCEAMVWGNGAVADNAWIRNAYHACGWPDKPFLQKAKPNEKEKAWSHTNDMCMRTIVMAARLKTGRNYKKEVPDNTNAHDALEDCRYQISYFVEAWKDIVTTETATELSTAADTEQAPITRFALPTPDTSFSEADDIPDYFVTSTPSHLAPPKRNRPESATAQPQSMQTKQNTSMSEADGDSKDPPAFTSKRSTIKQAAADPSPSSSPAFGAPPYPIVPFDQPKILPRVNAEIAGVPVPPSDPSVPKKDCFQIAVTVAVGAIPTSLPACEIQLPPRCLDSEISLAGTNTPSYKGLASLSPGTYAAFLEEFEDDEFADHPLSLTPVMAASVAIEDIKDHMQVVRAVVAGEHSMSDGNLLSSLAKEDMDPGPSSPTPSVLCDHNARLLDLNNERFQVDGSIYWELVEDGK